MDDKPGVSSLVVDQLETGVVVDTAGTPKLARIPRLEERSRKPK
jgi:hypothetical protein